MRWDAFEYEVLEDVSTEAEMIEREQYYIDTVAPSANSCRIATRTPSRYVDSV